MSDLLPRLRQVLAFRNGTPFASEALDIALVECVGAAEDAIAQIKDQRGVWPAEVDTLEEALARVRAEIERLDER